MSSSFGDEDIPNKFRTLNKGTLTSIDRLGHATSLAARVDFGVSKLGELVAVATRDICALVHGSLEGVIFPTEDVVSMVPITITVKDEEWDHQLCSYAL
jgi:hypothetical protein